MTGSGDIDDEAVNGMRLASGRLICPAARLISIAEDLELYTGADDGAPRYEDGDYGELSAEDMHYVADMMIDRWMRFKALAQEMVSDEPSEAKPAEQG